MPLESVLPYLDGLVSLLFSFLQKAEHHSTLLCLAMDVLSALGLQSKAHFAPYYSTLVPGIKNVLAVAKDSKVKKSAMLLVASGAESVGKEQFAKDAVDIVGWFLKQAQGEEHTRLDETNEVEVGFASPFAF
jgi:hypothetical protein